MADAEQPRDPRDALAALEQRLLDLERELRGQAGDDARAASGSATAPGGAPAAGQAPGPPIGVLLDETRERVETLRTSLDGIQTASDRLREVAQTVVEDHGRALVRLERAMARLPPGTTIEPGAEAQPDAGGEELPAWKQAKAAPDWAPTPRREIPWRVIAPLLAGLVALALILGLVLLLQSDDSGSTAAAEPQGVVATPEAARSGAAIGGVKGLRTTGSAVTDLCGGRAAAALTVTTDLASVRDCPGVARVASAPVGATGFANRGAGGRTCVSVPKARALTLRRENARLTERRAAVLDRVPRSASFAAGAAFDRRHHLHLLAVAPELGATCVKPTRTSLSDGTYPLTTHVVLQVADGHENDADVRAAADAMRTEFAGPPPLYATVLG